MNQTKTVKVGNQECLVQTLREWLNDRITQLRTSQRFYRTHFDEFPLDHVEANWNGRITELLIVREKLNDGRIDEIG